MRHGEAASGDRERLFIDFTKGRYYMLVKFTFTLYKFK